MATMLGFVATDAVIARRRCCKRLVQRGRRPELQPHHDRRRHLDQRFVRADRHAAGRARARSTSLDTPDGRALREAVVDVSQQLAQAIVRDGEGATKFITVRVDGGRDEAECRQVAYAIAHSPLVKTAFFASDPNLGRILAAVGYAGIDDLDQIADRPVPRRRARRAAGRPASRLPRRAGPAGDETAPRSPCASTCTAARRRARSGPATCRTTTSASTPTTARSCAAVRSGAPAQPSCAAAGRRWLASRHFPERGHDERHPHHESTGRPRRADRACVDRRRGLAASVGLQFVGPRRQGHGAPGHGGQPVDPCAADANGSFAVL